MLCASDLDCKWYRFDFEYVLPHGLPTSFKEPEAKLVYFASGSVVQPDGPEIETFDTKFHIRGIVDIDVFPRLWHEPTERRISKTYPVACDSDNVLANHSALAYNTAVGVEAEQQPLQSGGGGGGHHRHSSSQSGSGYHSEAASEAQGSGSQSRVPELQPLQRGNHHHHHHRPPHGEYNEITIAPGLEVAVIDIAEEDEVVPQLFAILWLNSQAFVVGERVTCDVKIENFTSHPVECILKLTQVSMLRSMHCFC